MLSRAPRGLLAVGSLIRSRSVATLPRLRVPATKILAARTQRYYAQGPGGGGFPGGFSFGPEKMEKGQALKEYVSIES
jgi:hypothetical protein